MAALTLPSKSKFNPQFALTDSSGNATQNFRNYLIALDALVTALAAGTAPSLVSAANDKAAAIGGVQVGQLYRNGNAVQVRLT